MCPTKSLSNPFEGQRWEQDSVNIIYLPQIFKEFEKKQDLYLVGSRGTGKTTFLKALNWKIRLKNTSIHMQTGKKNIFDGKYIGVYINTMSFGDSIFERSDIADSSLIFLYSMWTEINVIYRVLESIIGLYNKDYLDFTIEKEQIQANKIYDYIQDFFGDSILNKRQNRDATYNIIALKEVISKLRSKVIDERINLEWRYESYSIGNLIHEIIPSLMELCDDNDENEWYTKVCFDQIESAPNFQKIANTFVVKKLSKKVWFIVSGLNHRDIDINNTYIKQHNLTDDDRKFIDLNDVFFSTAPAENGDFYELTQGICDLRLKHFDKSIDTKRSFSLKTHLGSWNSNKILDLYLNRKLKISTSNNFKEFMCLVEENHEAGKYLTIDPPYIETYYFDILQQSQKWEGDMEKSREKNSDSGKKYIGTMLALLRKYKFKSTTPYVGIHQIMSLCNSTRDFLKIMKALFDLRINDGHIKDLDQFFSYKAPFTNNEIEIQTQAVVNVAEDKYNNIEQKYASEGATKKMRTFIDTCGQITYNLQAKIELSALSSEEKGIFSVVLQNDEDGKIVSDFLKSAHVDTNINIISNDAVDNTNIIEFELSRIFAPKYKFSFRKPRNKILIDTRNLIGFCKAIPKNIDFESDKLIEIVERKYQTNNHEKQTFQQKLF